MSRGLLASLLKPWETLNEIIGSAFATLKNAQLGAHDFFEGPTTSRRTAGLQNVMVWGRAVTKRPPAAPVGGPYPLRRLVCALPRRHGEQRSLQVPLQVTEPSS